MATNEILGGQHRVILGFSGGYGFAGIAVALMGRNHPVGRRARGPAVRRALPGRHGARLRDAAGQQGPGGRDPGPGDPVRRCAGEHVPAAARGAVRAPAARRRCRPDAWRRRLPAPPDAGQHDPAGRAAGAGGHGRAVLRARRRGRHRARGQDAGRRLRGRGRGADHRQRLAGRAGRDAVRRRASPWSMASPRSPIAATRWSRAWR